MSNYCKELNFWDNAHPHQEDCAALSSTDTEFAKNPLIMYVDLREKCKKKRESLPPLTSCKPLRDSTAEKPISLLSKMAQALHAKSKNYFQSLLFPPDAVVVRLNDIDS